MRFKYKEIIETANKIDKRLGMTIAYRDNSSFGLLGRMSELYDKKVLHFGCGNVEEGDHVFFKEMASEITSVDNDISSGADFKSLEDVTLEDYHDFLVTEHVLEHIPIDQIDNIAAEFKRLASKKGKVIITLPNIRNFGAWFSNYQHVNFAPPEQIAAIFELSGFTAIERYGWSKQQHFERHANLTNAWQQIAAFLDMEYGLQLYRYITYVLESKN